MDTAEFEGEVPCSFILVARCRQCWIVCLFVINITQTVMNGLADTRVNHTGVLAVGNYLGSSLAVGILTFVLNLLYGFNYVKINIRSHFIT